MAKKILVLGSGALKIGEAGEFDYSGSQCLKALREEGIETVLINPNIATIQTDSHMADKIYFLPLTPYFIEKIIEKEKPDGIMLSFGGQTALNCGIALYNKGLLKKYKVEVLGTNIETIKNTEDRALFVKKLNEIYVKTPEGTAVENVRDAEEAAKKLAYPVMIRSAYTLGGQGSGVAFDKTTLVQMAKKAFVHSPQILIEKYLGGWKEIEYEIVRDQYDNCIAVCNMENVDPMGIHTGESIVVAPSQTLTNKEYHKLRGIAIKTIRHLGIVGECNIQFALDPNSEDYRIIEVNARLSRSSALASKATGYPLAFVATKIALGYSLMELENKITKSTKSSFEPSMDYVIVKIPKWDLQKFKRVNLEIGSEMKSVGEVMAIGRKFEEALQKAIRMCGFNGLVRNEMEFGDLKKEISKPTDKRLLAVAEAIKTGIDVDNVHKLTQIDKWFLFKIKNIVEIEKEISKYKIKDIPLELVKKAKQYGFSDAQITDILSEKDIDAVRKIRKKYGITPVVKQIDTLAAEFPAKTNYLYLTYNGEHEDIELNGGGIIVLGSGAYKIGSSVEFDWCCVNAIRTIKELKHKTIMINHNPETVSTDYDMCDRLYFEELSAESVLDIYEKESPAGIIISMGGQIPNNLAVNLQRYGVKILGTEAEKIDIAEDRHKFSTLLDSLGVNQPEWIEAKSIEEVKRFAEKVNYPVLIRPSYVLSGAAMSVAVNENELKEYVDKAVKISKEYPVVVSKFITNAKEIEIDAVAKDGKIIIYAISEHIENAGVHSGDATIVLPPQYIYTETIRKIKIVANKISKALKITGPFNIQVIAKDNQIKVIECNLRASRSFPFVSKITKHNFIELATKAIMGGDISGGYDTINLDYVGVKAPQFSFARLHGADPMLSVEMSSTGEVACIGDDLHEALLKSLLAIGFKLPNSNVLLSTGPIKDKAYLLESINKLKNMGFKIYSTEGTAKFLEQNKIDTELVYWPLEKKEPNALTYIQEGKIDFVINIPKNYEDDELENNYLIRRKAVDFNIPLLTNAQIAKLFVESMYSKQIKDLKIKSVDEYQ